MASWGDLKGKASLSNIVVPKTATKPTTTNKPLSINQPVEPVKAAAPVITNEQKFTNKEAFPSKGESGIVYISQDTNTRYHWTGFKYAVTLNKTKPTLNLAIPKEESNITNTSINRPNIVKPEHEPFKGEFNYDLYNLAELWEDMHPYKRGDTSTSLVDHNVYTRLSNGSGDLDPYYDNLNWKQKTDLGCIEVMIGTDTDAKAFTDYIFLKSCTLDLPNEPAEGDWIGIKNRTSDDKCFIDPCGKAIDGIVGARVIKIQNYTGRIIYVNKRHGWCFL